MNFREKLARFLAEINNQPWKSGIGPANRDLDDCNNIWRYQADRIMQFWATH